MKKLRFVRLGILALGLFMLPFFTEAGSGDRASGWAWADNIGWISFNSIDCDPDENGFADGVPSGCPGPTTPTASGLVGHWALDDGSPSPTAADSTGTNDGILTNMDPNTDWVSGQINGALDFDGSNDYVDAGNDSSLNPAGAITIAAWVNPSSLSSIHDIVNKHQAISPFNQQFGLQARSDRIRFSVTTGGYQRIDSTPGLPTDTWTHVAAVYDGIDLRVYRDAVLSGSPIAQTGSMSDSGSNLTIGANETGGSAFSGKIDDVRVYSRALSPAEITELYDYGIGVLYPDYGVDINLGNGALSGYAWSDSVGWIQFDAAGPYPEAPNYAACFDRVGVSGEACDGAGNNTISGWARALSNGFGWDGWIKLRDTGAFPYGADWTSGTQELTGWAWGSDVVGWISFNCGNDHDSVAPGTQSVCGTSDYKVMLDTNTAPDAPSNLQDNEGTANYCAGFPAVTLSWDYTDLDDSPVGADPQSAYQVQLKEGSTDFSSPDIDSGKINNAGNQYAPQGAQALSYGTVYYWRARVWDSKDKVSAWSAASSPFTTAAHAWPNPSGFSWTPLFPEENELIQFDDEDPFDSASNPVFQTWAWDFESDGFVDSGIDDPMHSYSPVQPYDVELETCDELGCCAAAQTINVALPAPIWKEISPINPL